ncbi:hypothetical protein OGAPHI_004847 [Ogataea philodendri]|uniref:t-SNARE coiled-coil homology domain-containing protein n=1 Tax=Ogataea philodendri TaxID=1378263 RepID=A0A9P8P1L0_9ASCO|nr:uncharacterized protein OGAPHI_004847 [Ogataea philodendri]KAH3664133.1 hypothetical protein OGAPHI_004847 [Ogataea philodendri]
MATLERQFAKLELLKEEIVPHLEDYQTLKQSGEEITLSSNDELLLTFSKLGNLFKYLELLLVENAESPNFPAETARFRKELSNYNRQLDQIQMDIPKDLNLEIDTSKLDEAEARPRPRVKKTKSVRFKKNLIDPSEAQKRRNSSSAGVYKDEPNKQNLFETTGSYSDTQEPIQDPLGMSNRQIFIENQQELLNQDEIVNSLSQSVNRQHEMSLAIGDEVDDHMVLLDDLETGISRANAKLIRGQSNIARFTRQLKEHGDWFTIFVLVVIMLILLVILK